MSLNKKAIVVFSGGQDSTTCLFWALENFHEVIAITFDYGQRHIDEIACAKEITSELNIKHHILDVNLINQLSANALTREDMEISAALDTELPSTYVEGRNHIFFSFAAIFAKQYGAKHIVTGVCETDFSGYPDCRDVFVKSLNVTLNLAMNYEFVIHTPLMWLNKEQTWEMADKLGKLKFIKEKTLTCYEGIRGDGCGICPSCVLRKRGFENYLQKKGKEKHDTTVLSTNKS
ncbi:7-cyano-7-deazaguanine synthase QueC [Metabacillus idriensis]|uniref:7-cyano-7-deazaguanine synthase QueC n=1 Tax=Metabacillus idriensis TaxID=324768 RepID=UPI00174A618F|nr:7-cyano-7-deazaguanine synthase QueC [Metabacillus idriensis]